MAVALTEEQVLCSYLVQHPNLARMYADSFDKGIFLVQLHIDVYAEIKRCFHEGIEVNRYTLSRKFGDMLDPYIKLPVSEKTALVKIDALIRSQVEYYTSFMLSKRCQQYQTLQQQGEKINNDAFVNELVSLLDVGTQTTSFTPNDAVDYLMEQIKNPQKREKGISTGYPCLDKMLNGGFKKKHLNVILGNSGMGKTSFVENLQLQMSLAEQRGIFFSMEMPSQEVAEDWFGILSGTRFNKVIEQNEYVSTDGLDNLVVHLSKIKNHLEIIDEAEISVGAIQRIVRMRKMQQRPLDYIIVDHFHILKRPNKPTEAEALAEVARLLKVLAKEENIAVIVLAQVNRDVKDRKMRNPLLSDVKGSAGLGENSDVVLGLYRPSYDIKQHSTPDPALANVIEITFPKGRRLDADKLLMEINWTSGRLVGQLSEMQEVDYLRALSAMEKTIGGAGGKGVDFAKK